MARLNESNAFSESLDALKRRFIRQNRDLARSNSTQSVKIRQQEGEIAHLLSENASLREKVLQLENELVTTSCVTVRGSIDALRFRIATQLEEFTAQMNESLSDLALLQNRTKQENIQLATSPKRSPARRELRNTSTLCEVLASQGQTLPTIDERECYPQANSPNHTVHKPVPHNQKSICLDESPKVERPVTFLDRENDERPELHFQTNTAQAKHDNDGESILSSIEIRRKRRHSSLLSDSNDGEDTSMHPLKFSAKRKIPESLSKSLTNSRPVLKPKSINTDPSVSPRKAQVLLTEEILPLKEVLAASPPLTKTELLSHDQCERESKLVESNVKKDKVVITSVPSTHAASLSTVSPHTMQASAADQSQGRLATPPPTINEAAILGRSSRRARQAVSYAEPKLNLKMRRPGKELVDAVNVRRGPNSEPDQQSEDLVIDVGSQTSSVSTSQDEGMLAVSPLHSKNQGFDDTRDRRPVEEVLDTENKPGRGKKKATESYSQGKGGREGVSQVAPASPPQKPTTLPDSSHAKNGHLGVQTKASTRRPSKIASTSESFLTTKSRISTINDMNTRSGSLRHARRQTLNSDAVEMIHVPLRPASAGGDITLKQRTSVASTQSIDALTNDSDQGEKKASYASASNVRAERAARIAQRRRSMML